MLYCEECGEIFWESNLDEGRYCPSCGADVVTPAGECRQCGETFPPQDIEGGLCRDCRDDLKRRCCRFCRLDKGFGTYACALTEEYLEKPDLDGRGRQCPVVLEATPF